MKILDYIFYRLYNAYARKDESPVFASICVLCMIILSLSIPFVGTLYELFRNDCILFARELMLLDIFVIFSLLALRYGKKKKRDKLLHSIRNENKWDKVPDYFFYLILNILSFIVGISLYIFIKKQFVDTYSLEGALWRLISQ